MQWTLVIPAKQLHNHDIVSVYFKHFYCTEICDKLSRALVMLTKETRETSSLVVLTYIYLNVDDW